MDLYLPIINVEIYIFIAGLKTWGRNVCFNRFLETGDGNEDDAGSLAKIFLLYK